MRKKSQIILLLTTLMAANLLLWTSSTLARRNDAFSQIGLLMALRRELVTSHVEKPDAEKMIRAAIRGMISSLDDPYTTFLFPDDMKQFDKHVRGSFSGIGAEVMIDDVLNRVKIISPLEESPAWKAGVLAGDVILAIDGEDTEGMKITEAVSRLTGPRGTEVVILVRHKTGDEETITITRAQINIQTVKGFTRDKDHHWNFMLDEVKGIGYIRLTQFNDKTSADLRQALKWLNDHQAKALILDLRFNPGGLLSSAIEVSDMFLTKDQTIVSVRGRSVENQSEHATDEATIFTKPMVVIANEASASASEIVTGALHDNHRAKFIGTRTFGKGSVQQVRMLESDQGALKITNAYYYLPNGEKIHRIKDAKEWGVNPDEGFYVPMHAKQLREMLKIRRDGDVLQNDNGKNTIQTISPQWIDENLKDNQLSSALTSLTAKLDTDEWIKVGEDGAEAIRTAIARENLLRHRGLLQERIAQVDKELAQLDDPDEAEASKETSTPTDEQAAAQTQPADAVETAK